MFGKLMTFEFKSSIKALGAVWAGVLAATLLLGSVLNIVTSNDSTGIILQILTSLSSVIYWGLLIAMAVVTLILVIQRFYKGLIGEEGYLMHTLPISTRSLIISKGLCASIYVIIGSMVCLISIYFLISFVSEGFPDIFDSIRHALSEVPQYGLIFFEGILLMLLATIGAIYKIYTSLSVGQLANKHRILIAVATYIGIEIIESLIQVIFIIVIDKSSVLSNSITSVLYTEDVGALIMVLQPYCVLILIYMAIKILVFHIATENILSKKLNLQ